MCYIITYYVQKRENVLEIEEGKLLSPKFDNDGLIPVITMFQNKRYSNAWLYEC